MHGSVNRNSTQEAGRSNFFISPQDDYPTQVLRSGNGTLLIAGYSEMKTTFDRAEMFARINYSATGAAT